MDTKELVQQALNQKPAEFSDTFKELMLDKIQTAVNARKAELAQNIIVDNSEQEEEQEEEEEIENA